MVGEGPRSGVLPTISHTVTSHITSCECYPGSERGDMLRVVLCSGSCTENLLIQPTKPRGPPCLYLAVRRCIKLTKIHGCGSHLHKHNLSAMRFILLTVLICSVVTCTRAVTNCKCQDSNGQYNLLTHACCKTSQSAPFKHFPGPNHQCDDPFNKLKGSSFNTCCQSWEVGGSFCWD